MKSLKATLKIDHNEEVASLQEKFAAKYEKVESEVGAVHVDSS